MVIVSSVMVAAAGEVPAHCQIDGTIAADIGLRLVLPLKWNGRLYMYGNGGFSGEDADGAKERASLGAGLANGFAVVRTDTGHLASRDPWATFAANPSKMVNHAYLAVHETVQYAKQAMASFYGRPASHTYCQGCSTGGPEGVTLPRGFRRHRGGRPHARLEQQHEGPVDAAGVSGLEVDGGQDAERIWRGNGPGTVDALTPVINWVEGGTAPDRPLGTQRACHL